MQQSTLFEPLNRLSSPLLCQFLFFMELGLEPRTLCMLGKCRTVELYPPLCTWLLDCTGSSMTSQDKLREEPHLPESVLEVISRDS